MNRLLVLLVLVSVVAACGEHERPTLPDDNKLTGVNKWMREDLEDWYLWNDALEDAAAPDNDLAFDEFLRASLIPLSDAKDADGTMDGGYRNGQRYLYSRIERFSGGGTRASSASEQMTFGLGVIVLQYSESDRYGVLVTWILPGGPAERAGLKRGAILNLYNDQPIRNAELDELSSHLFSRFTTPLSLTDEDGTEYTINGGSFRVDPILDFETLETGGGKTVAYLMYNSFEQGGDIDRGDEMGEFDRELRTVFGGFKAAGATELVIDLRYNGGGAVRSAQLLSSLAGRVTVRQAFTKMQYNRSLDVENPQVWNFRNEPNSLGLSKVYVLGTSQTASSSELVINSLRGVDVDVVLIGETTEGKNVGMNLQEHTEGIFRYEMWPITFKSSNAKDFSNYSAGFKPDVELDELGGRLSAAREELREFGDPEEVLLRAALTLIDGGTVQSSRHTRADEIRTTPISDPRKGGARVYNLPATK